MYWLYYTIWGGEVGKEKFFSQILVEYIERKYASYCKSWWILSMELLKVKVNEKVSIVYVIDKVVMWVYEFSNE